MGGPKGDLAGLGAAVLRPYMKRTSRTRARHTDVRKTPWM
jgi:hypothetical protein